jgi:ABC-2 type transport system permease protein
MGKVFGGYSVYFFPGMLGLTVMFTAIFSSISLIEDRNSGFLQAVLVSKASRSSIVVGKVLAGAMQAFCQSGILVLLAPTLGIDLTVESLALVFLNLAALSLFLSTIGFLSAWRFNSVQSFHSVMNVFLFPMWLLSGALFPKEGALTWMQWLMNLNPMYFGLEGLRLAFFSGEISIRSLLPVIGMGILSVLLVGVSSWAVSSTKGGRS